MTDNYVSIKQLASELQMDRSHARKYIIGLGISIAKRRTPDSGNQLTLTISSDDAEFIRQKRLEQGFLGSPKPVQNETGVFYIIQLIPELDPRRIKLGFADYANSRLSQHRTSSPTAKLLKTWPCKRSWETTIIDALSSVGGSLILNEVFVFDDIDTLIEYGDRLFLLLPDPNAKIVLSDASPLKRAES
jgi:hypothetical protein